MKKSVKLIKMVVLAKEGLGLTLVRQITQLEEQIKHVACFQLKVVKNYSEKL